MSRQRLLVLLLLVVLAGVFFALDLQRFLSLAYVKTQQAHALAWVRARPLESGLLYAGAYVLVTGLSLPGAVVLTLAGGALFGLLWGTVLVSFASTTGATLAFLASRFVLRDAVRRRFEARLHAVDRGVERDGPFYLFTLRLVPAFPFFVVNLVMGLTPMRTLTYAWVSQVGMLPATIVFVNAGTQLGRLESVHGVLSPALLASFTLLGLFPLAARKALALLRRRRVYAGWRRPRRFDRNLVVIGAGSAGLVSAYVAAAAGARVTLVESHRMGGDCLNTGCVPSKALIRTTRFLAEARRARALGVREARVEFDFAEVMARVREVVRGVAPHDSVERYQSLGVECLHGAARISSPWTVEVGERTLCTRAIVIATGARPAVPPIPGLAEMDYLTSDTLWDIETLPRRLLVLGGGPIGCELAQAFARLGARVTQVEMLERLLAREDEEVSTLVAQRFREEGVRVLTGHRAKNFRVEGREKLLTAEHANGEVEIAFDEVLVAVGRVPDTEGLGLEELGVPLTRGRAPEVDAHLATRFANVYACGDVAGPYQFTHTAAHQAWYATVNALFGHLYRLRADYSVIPWAVFTEPEVARVGLNERDARERGIAFEVTRYPLAELDRAIADGVAEGFVKVLTTPAKDRILGVTIVGEHAGDVIAEYVLAMRNRLGLGRVLRTIHIYPTLAEANKYAAGVWRRAHAPRRVLGVLRRYHDWRRG